MATPDHENLDPPLELDVHEVKRLIDGESELFLVDCRIPAENEYCRIDGSELVPMDDLPSRMETLEPYREKQIVVYCHHGIRSLHVVRWLRSQGFQYAQNMAGGIDAWSIAIDSDVPRY